MESRRPLFLAGTFALALLLTKILAAQSLSVRLDAGKLRIAAVQVPLLAGEALVRLHDGASVNYALRISVLKDRAGSAYSRVTTHCVVSFDVFEEKFKATRLEPVPRSMSNLSSAAAEGWCLDALTVAAPAIPPGKPFWISLEYEAEEPRPARDQEAASLGRIVDFFGKKPPKATLKGVRLEGPYSLQELSRSNPARETQ